MKRVGTGHAILGGGLPLGGDGLPLAIRGVSTPGRRKLDPLALAQEIGQEGARRREAGLSPEGLRRGAEAWDHDSSLQAVAVAEGVVGISEGKTSFPFEGEQQRLNGRDRLQRPLTATWEGERVQRLQATHAPFGTMGLVVFAEAKAVRDLLVAGRPLRAKEAGGAFLLGRRLLRQLKRDIHPFRHLPLGPLWRLAQRSAVTWPAIQEPVHHLTVGKASVLGNL